MHEPLIDVPQPELDELRERLRATRWATRYPITGWDQGTDPDELQRLVSFWAGDFDWRAQEAAINALPSHFADLDGVPLHYLRFDPETPGALPLVLTHGWPSSFLELAGLALRLAEPSRFGGDPADAFTVIVPSLPGFPFSPQRPQLPDDPPTEELWHRLMRTELGFERYGAHGGDLGVGVTSRLGQRYPDEVVGLHIVGAAEPVNATDLTPQEQEHQAKLTAWMFAEGAYALEQSTKPMTLAAGLSDSPAGLLAWILEKYRTWSDCDGDVAGKFGDDFLLTQASLYWFTNCVSTSFRPYFQRASAARITKVEVPTAVAVFPFNIAQEPRSWAERTYNVTQYTRMPRGGHFPALEEPELLLGDLRKFFGGLR